MKTLRSKILLALIASAVLALLVVTLITRVGLHRGFFEFIERQEARQLENLVPELVEIYESDGSWRRLSNNPRLWRMMTLRSRNGGFRGAEPPGPPPGAGPLHLRDRLFLLDVDKERIAGARMLAGEPASLEPVEVGGITVGWVGFRPLRQAQTPEALMFLAGQARSTLISLGLALLLASVMGFVLARHISRPVSRLRDMVGRLTEGDYTARAAVETQDEIGSLATGVNRLAGTLEKNESARRRWMADIAHELRTPIAVLKGELEALDDGVRQADERTLISLKEEVTQLADLVDDLQTLALADAGALQLNLQSMDLGILLRRVGDAFLDRMADRQISLQVEAPGAIRLEGDMQRIKQVLNNLLENALRYTHSGGQVRLSLNATPAEAEIFLEDSAPGVSDEQLDKLFDRFYRTGEGRNRAGGGSGLGLSICRNIVESHGGTISAGHSRLGGLAIRVSLPLKG